jgi:hypothetical protein
MFLLECVKYLEIKSACMLVCDTRIFAMLLGMRRELIFGMATQHAPTGRVNSPRPDKSFSMNF